MAKIHHDEAPESFDWVTTEEPHAARRKEMLTKDYAPELRKLMKSDWTLTYWVLILVAIQLSVAWLMRSADMLRLFLAAYCIGGTCNHSLALAMHELSHNLAFGYLHVTANRWLAWIANIPIGLPAASTFKKYHLEHHKYQGNAELDADLPTEFEGHFFTTTFRKTIWLFLQPLFYSLRPVIAYPRPVTQHELINLAIQLTCNALVVYFFSWKSLLYFIIGTIFGYGIHPISGHFISEHYTFIKGIETYSYYGPLNWLTYNVGYHNEHHDFPNVPGRFLPDVKKTAPEFYDNLPSYRSWTKVLVDFALDPHVNMYSRIKRLSPGKRIRVEQKPVEEPHKAKLVYEEDLLADDGECSFEVRHRRAED